MIELGQPHRCQLDADRIVTRIYQGSYPPPGREVARCGFDVLVLCAVELQTPALFFDGVQVIHCPLDDAELTAQEWARAQTTARKIAVRLHGRPQSRALITCAAGRNRSGLVTALTLHLITGKSGLQIIEHIRKRRRPRDGTLALTNPSFLAALVRL
jgi:hypothetical protein